MWFNMLVVESILSKILSNPSLLATLLTSNSTQKSSSNFASFKVALPRNLTVTPAATVAITPAAARKMLTVEDMAVKKINACRSITYKYDCDDLTHWSG